MLIYKILLLTCTIYSYSWLLRIYVFLVLMYAREKCAQGLDLYPAAVKFFKNILNLVGHGVDLVLAFPGTATGRESSSTVEMKTRNW